MTDELEGYERRFRRAGLPLFIAGSTARADVWTRAVPVLALVLLGELLGAVDLAWTALENLLAVAGGLAILLAGFALVNRLRGRRPLARPDDIGPAELVAFVLVPALLPLINGQPTSAFVTALGNLVLLGVLYVLIAYGVGWIVVFAFRRLGEQLAASAQLVARAIPLLLLFSVVLFLTTEMWQAFAAMDSARLAAVIALLLAFGTLFLAIRLPREVRALEDHVGEGPPLDRRQRVNVGFVLFVSQALQVLVVVAGIALFFVAFGLLAIDDGLLRTWTGEAPEEIVTVGGIIVSVQLLKVALIIGAFAGLNYAIALLTDSTYRSEFVEEITDDLRASFTDRAAYLRLRAAGGRDR